ncbi:MAG: glycosyltransferase family 4 protein [Acetatifactor sp.]|nr:glycosyltransferase family 4 protein [Acetatifactor sp.]
MKILYTTNLPSPYRVDFWNLLSRDLEVTVIFERKKALDRDDKWQNNSPKRFKEVYCKGISYGADSIISITPLKYVFDKDIDLVIVGNATSVTGIIMVMLMKMFKVKYVVEGDGAFVKEGRENLIKFWLKKTVISKALACLSTCNNHDEYYLKYGAKEDSIYRYSFSSIHEKDILSTPISLDEKRYYREKLGIKEKRTVLYIGQFIYRKGCDILVDVARKLDNDIGVIMVGGNEFSADVKEMVGKLPTNVHIYPFMKPEELKEFFLAADVFVLPTREDIWGLVVNEAMGYGVPVITTSMCNAGLELIKNDYNGMVVQSNSNSILEAIISILNKPIDIYHMMQENALESMKYATIERMVQDHRNIFSKLIDK